MFNTSRRFFAFFICLIVLIIDIKSQQSYYDEIDFQLAGTQLKDDLSTLIISTHSNYISYATAYQILKQTDEEPNAPNLVRLIYGSNDLDELVINDLTRDENMTGGSIGDWNREHVYPKSLATPPLTNSGSGADVHLLRACDLQMNSTRSNRKFRAGTGDANYNQIGWYPGDDWKGDCARIIMYAYLHYGTRCLPSNVGVGDANVIDEDMLDLFLTWNAEDEVSEYELQRNEILESVQGNRNPFIDNPAFATKIWGGIEASDPWNLLYSDEITLEINAFLEGPFIADSLLMTDYLREGEELPNNEPYSALGCDCQPNDFSISLLDVTGDSAITDWVLVELRDPNNPSIILSAKAGLIQRNGDIVSGLENTPFTMELPNENEFFVVIRHRNHFGVRTAQTYSKDSLVVINFADPDLAVSGIDSRKITNDTALLISGDANGDGVINVVDKNSYWRNQNGQPFSYNSTLSDFNLDGNINSIDKNNHWRFNNSKIQYLD
jgi:endonuclease I